MRRRGPKPLHATWTPLLKVGAVFAIYLYELPPGFAVCGPEIILSGLLDKKPRQEAARTFEPALIDVSP